MTTLSIRNGTLNVQQGRLSVDSPPLLTPLGITSATLLAWYDFSDATTMFTDQSRTTPVSSNGDSVRGVTDKSGNAFHLTDAAGTSPPTYNTSVQNGQDVATSIDGNSGFEHTSALGSGQPVTVIAVAASRTSTPPGGFASTLIDGRNSGAGRVFIALNGGGSNAALETGAGSNMDSTILTDWSVFGGSWHIHVLEANGASSNTWVENTADLVTQNLGTNSFSAGIRIGRNEGGGGSAGWAGPMGEVAVFETNTISSAERIALVNSLKTKWGIA